MNCKLIVALIISSGMFLNLSYAEDGHDHSSQEKSHNDGKHSKDDGHNHKKKKHDDHKGHGEEDGYNHKKHKEGDGHDDHKGHDDHSGHDDDKGHDDHSKHDDHEGHGGGKAIGKGKAIEEVDEKKGFRLSKEAIKTLKLKLNTVDGSSFKISKKTLVASKNTKGVYRFRAGFFKLLPAKITKELSDGYVVEVKGVDFGDQIVIDGVGLLRVTDVYSTDKSEYGHSH